MRADSKLSLILYLQSFAFFLKGEKTVLSWGVARGVWYQFHVSHSLMSLGRRNQLLSWTVDILRQSLFIAVIYFVLIFLKVCQNLIRFGVF